MSAPLDLLAGVAASTAAGRVRKARPSDDLKRALRAERNRQSAAASRDRKKQHLRELEARVRYLGDVSAALGSENARLAKLLSAALADNDRLRAQLQRNAAGTQ